MKKIKESTSKSSSRSGGYANGVTYNYKNSRLLNRKNNFSSDDIEVGGLNQKNNNKKDFKASTKQAITQKEYKKLKKKYNFNMDEIEEKDEEKDEKNSKSSEGAHTPPSRLKNKIHAEKINNNKVITDSEDENENEEKKNKHNDNNNISEYNSKLSKVNKNKKRKRKWDEEEYQRIKSEAKNYIPFSEYDTNKFLLTPPQINIIVHYYPELYEKYKFFLSMKKKQEKIQSSSLIKNILKELNHIIKEKNHLENFKVDELIDNQSLIDFEYKSNNKTAYFDLFICFISIFIEQYESHIRSISNLDKINPAIPLHELAFIFSSKVFFCIMAKLIQSYYEKFLSYKIVPIYIKEKEEYRNRINKRGLIWKQFEPAYFYYKNNKKLFEQDKKKFDEKKIEKFSEEIAIDVKNIYRDNIDIIRERHDKINVFNINDEKIEITKNKISAPSSLCSRIDNDDLFKLKMRLFKYRMRFSNINKTYMVNKAMIYKNDFKNKIKNKLFKQSIFYVQPSDVVKDFLENS